MEVRNVWFPSRVPVPSVITYSHFGREARIILKIAKPYAPTATQKKHKRSPYDVHHHVVPRNCRTIVLPSNAQGAEEYVLPTFPIDVLLDSLYRLRATLERTPLQ